MAQCVVCSNDVFDEARFCPSCGAEQPKAGPAGGEGDDPLIGRVIARNFKIESLLGVGGMGKVYKARQLSLDKAVVIKILHNQFRDDPQLVQRFQREARAASRLNHPNSIQVIDFGQDESDVLYMAIEYLEGRDLFNVLQEQGPFSDERLARVMIQVCSALAEAHDQHVIHRDLKPENIMVEDRRGQKDYVKVLDFGIAKIQDPQASEGQALTQAGMVCGTPEFMSPEQARGLSLDARSDLYALGVVSFQLATGELPFHADTPIGIVTKHILEEPPSPREKRPAISVAMDALILKAMAKDPAERFQSAIEMGEAFEAVLHGARAPATPAPARLASGSTRVDVGVAAMHAEAQARRTQDDPSPQASPRPAGPTLTTPTEDQQPALRIVDQSRASQGGAPITGAATTLTLERQAAGLQSRGPLVAAGAFALAVLAGGTLWWVTRDAAAGEDAALAALPPSAPVPSASAPPTAPPAAPPTAPPEGGAPAPGAPAAVPPANVAPANADPAPTAPATPAVAAATATAAAAPASTSGTGPPGSAPPLASATGPSPAPVAAARPPAKVVDPPESDTSARARPARGGGEGRRKKAKSLHREANKLALSDDAADRREAYEMLKEALDLDPGNPAPLQVISYIHKRNGDTKKACNAMRAFVKQKQLPESSAAPMLKGACASGS